MKSFAMTDTLDQIYKIQYDIIAAKSPEERAMLGADIIDSIRRWVENSIRIAKPEISEIDLKIEMFLRYYQHDFSKTEQEKIINSMREYYRRNKINLSFASIRF